VGVGVIVNFRQKKRKIPEKIKKKERKEMDSDFSCPENGNGTDYASSADDSTLTQVSTGW